jgi:endothelin-converting enzyme/putative endopeptidase
MRIRHLLLGASLLASVPTLAATPKFGTWGYDATAMDAAVKPGDDFFDYVNGAWAKRTEIAADRTFVGIDSVLNDQIDKDVRAIVEDMAKNSASSGKIGQQVGDFYASFMDQPGIEARGTAPLKPYLARIQAIKDKASLTRLFVDPSYTGPVGFGINPDPQDPTRYVAIAGQGGLGMPNRDYYLLEGAKYDAYRKAYRDYIVKIQELAGIADAEAKADRILALETAIAKVHWTPERSREIKDIYNPMDEAKMKALAPEFDWHGMLKQAGLDKAPTVIVMQPSAFQGAGKLIASTPLQTWKDYETFHFISSHAQFLPKAFDDANFARRRRSRRSRALPCGPR